MPTPRLFLHVIADPSRTPQLPGHRGTVAGLLAAQAGLGRAIPLVQERSSALMTAVTRTTALLDQVIAEYSLPRHDTEWDEVDIYVFQSAPDNPDPTKAGGVMGFYNDGVEGSMDFAPHMALYVLPGFESRLPAAALHELGHFLRSRATWNLDAGAFIYWAFEEGLSEHLVRLTLGLEHVIHNIPLQHGELECLQEQVQVSLQEVGDPDRQPPKSLAGYRLGYHVVQRLLDEGHPWLSLLRLPLGQTGPIMQEQTRQLLEAAF